MYSSHYGIITLFIEVEIVDDDAKLRTLRRDYKAYVTRAKSDDVEVIVRLFTEVAEDEQDMYDVLESFKAALEEVQEELTFSSRVVTR